MTSLRVKTNVLRVKAAEVALVTVTNTKTRVAITTVTVVTVEAASTEMKGRLQMPSGAWKKTRWSRS